MYAYQTSGGTLAISNGQSFETWLMVMQVG